MGVCCPISYNGVARRGATGQTEWTSFAELRRLSDYGAGATVVYDGRATPPCCYRTVSRSARSAGTLSAFARHRTSPRRPVGFSMSGDAVRVR
jgi:hypothetical protein